MLPSPAQETEDKLIYDMDSKSTRNQSEEVPQSAVKRKRQISEEETEDAVNSILTKRRRDSNGAETTTPSLDDSGYQGEPDDEVIIDYNCFVDCLHVERRVSSLDDPN